MPLNRTRSAVRARQDAALRLRQQGLTYSAIALQLGYTENGNVYASAARNAVLAALARQAIEGSITLRRFGVEMETVGLDRFDLANAIAAVVGDHVPVFDYHGRTCQCCGRSYTNEQKLATWKVERDGSLRYQGSGSLTGEVVSPILEGEAGFAQLEQVVTALYAAGARTNATCGLHVHVEASDLDSAAVARVVEFYTSNGHHIDGLVSQSRRDGQWARKYSPSQVASMKASAQTASHVSALRGFADKYRVVNITPLFSYGTIEFRQHQGTTNAAKVAAWVRFVQSVVIAAKDATEVDTAAELDALIDGLTAKGLDADTARFLQRRAASLRARRTR